MTFFRKALSHKYLFKIPTGKTGKRGKPLYRYFYKYSGEAFTQTRKKQGQPNKKYTDVNPSLRGSLLKDGIKVGMAFRDASQGKKHGGHWVVVDEDTTKASWQEKYKVRHDETGEIRFLSRYDVEELASQIHEDEIQDEAKRRERRRELQVRAAIDTYRARWPQLPENMPEAVESRKHRARLRSLMKLAQNAGKFDYLNVINEHPQSALEIGSKALDSRLTTLRSQLAGVFATEKQDPIDLVDSGDFDLAKQVALYWRTVDELRSLNEHQRDNVSRGAAKGKLSNVRLIDIKNPPPVLARATPTQNKIKRLIESYKALIDSQDANISIAISDFVKSINDFYTNKDQTNIFIGGFNDYDTKKDANARLAYRILISQGIHPIHSSRRACPTSPFAFSSLSETSKKYAFLLTDTPAALAIDRNELTAQLLAGHVPEQDMIAKTKILINAGLPNMLVRQPEGDYHYPTQKLAEHLQSDVRGRLDARAKRHRTEIAPIVANVQAEIESGLVKVLSQQIRSNTVDELRPLLVAHEIVSEKDFDKFKSDIYAQDKSIIDMAIDNGVPISKILILPADIKEKMGDSHHNIELTRALFAHFHSKWKVPNTKKNIQRLSNLEAQPDWGNDVTAGTLPSHRAEDFAQMLHPDLMPRMYTLHVNKISDSEPNAKIRAFATAHIPLVDKKDDHSVFWHEAAHTVENASRDLGRRTKDFFMHRIEKSKDYNYNVIYKDLPDEKGYRDNFLDAYTGKWYYREGLGDEDQHSSEILSMAASYLGQDVKKFAKKDPEHLAFSLLAFSGQLGLRDSDNDAQAEQKVKQRIQQGTYSLSGLKNHHRTKGAG